MMTLDILLKISIINESEPENEGNSAQNGAGVGCILNIIIIFISFAICLLYQLRGRSLKIILLTLQSVMDS